MGAASGVCATCLYWIHIAWPNRTSSKTEVKNFLSTSLEWNLTRLYRVELYNSQRNMVIVSINLDNATSELLEAECREASAWFIIGVPSESGSGQTNRSLESESTSFRLIFHKTRDQHDPTPSGVCVKL